MGVRWHATLFDGYLFGDPEISRFNWRPDKRTLVFNTLAAGGNCFPFDNDAGCTRRRSGVRVDRQGCGEVSTLAIGTRRTMYSP